MQNYISTEMLENKSTKIGVIGLGYVGLPLAISFSKKYNVIGFDINKEKIEKLKAGNDYTGEIENTDILNNDNISYTSDYIDLVTCKVIIVAVPTPIDNGNNPDLTPLLSACSLIGEILKSNSDIYYICFESTVYPGCTEEDCKPLIEKISGKTHGVDFYLGYSPERINPGDKKHTFENITKVVSGCCHHSCDFFAQLYNSVINAGVHIASSIKVAEAAKIIENTQRDINIALINELSIIFSKLKIDTHEVLSAARTKWNFLNFIPGLVGGHCIGVDPYYLTYKAETVGYIPKVILSGRAINDSMASFVASETVKLVLKNKPKNSELYRCLILGFTFKENISDFRNTKVVQIFNTLKEFNFHTDIVDPLVDKKDVYSEYNIEINTHLNIDFHLYDCIILAVPHHELITTIEEIINQDKQYNGVFVDVKAFLNTTQIAQVSNQMTYWRL